MQRLRDDTYAHHRSHPEADGLPDGKADGSDHVALAETYHGDEGARDNTPDVKLSSYHGTDDTVG